MNFVIKNYNKIILGIFFILVSYFVNCSRVTLSLIFKFFAVKQIIGQFFCDVSVHFETFLLTSTLQFSLESVTVRSNCKNGIAEKFTQSPRLAFSLKYVLGKG